MSDPARHVHAGRASVAVAAVRQYRIHDDQARNRKDTPNRESVERLNCGVSLRCLLDRFRPRCCPARGRGHLWLSFGTMIKAVLEQLAADERA